MGNVNEKAGSEGVMDDLSTETEMQHKRSATATRDRVKQEMKSRDPTGAPRTVVIKLQD